MAKRGTTRSEITLAVRSLENNYHQNKNEITRLLNLQNCDEELLIEYAFPFSDLMRGPGISIRRQIRKSKKITYKMIFEYLSIFYDNFDEKMKKNVHIMSRSGSIDEFVQFFYNPNFSSKIFTDLLVLNLSNNAIEHVLRWALDYDKSEVWILKKALLYPSLRYKIAKHPNITNKIVHQVYSDIQKWREEHPGSENSQEYWKNYWKREYELITLSLIRNPQTSLEFIKGLIPNLEELPLDKDYSQRLLRTLIRTLPDDNDRERSLKMLMDLPKSRKNKEMIAYASRNPEFLATFIYGTDEGLRNIAALNPYAYEADMVFVILLLGDKPKHILRNTKLYC